MRHEEKPSTPGEALEHHGVKGMRWGHRKKEEAGGDDSPAQPDSANTHPFSERRYLTISEARAAAPSATGRVTSESAKAKSVALTNASLKRMMAEAVKMDSKPSEANLMSHKQMWADKWAAPDPKTGRTQPVPIAKERKKLTPTQKKLLKGAAIGVGVVGTAYLLNKAGKRAMGYTPIVESAIKGQHKGQPISAKEFNTLVLHSQMKTWSVNNHMKGDAFAREAFELPVGHTFRRLSQHAESAYVKPTYSVIHDDDWHRYLTNFRHEKVGVSDFHEVSWKLTQPVKVPALKDVIGSVQEVLKAEGKGGTEREAMNAYQSMSGGGWRDVRSENLIKTLKKKGYGAIIDEMDAGVIGDKPLVFFSPEAATNRSSKPLSNEALTKAETLVKELESRKV